jgi:peroxiredoxin
MYGVVRDPTDRSPGYARRTTFLVDPSGRVAKTYEVRDTDGHAGEVLADIQGLAEGN